MPQFAYRGLDARNQPQSGVIDALTEDEAIRRLAGQGLRVQSLTRAVQARLNPPLRQSARPVERPAFAEAKPAKVAPVPKLGIVRTRRCKDRVRFFAFTQLANLLQAGVSPADACQQVSGRTSHPDMAKALQAMARHAAAGGSLADAMDSYIDLFEPGQAGAVRAGEQGGYTWEACEKVANQLQSVMGLRRVYWWVALLINGTLLSIPMVLVAGVGIDRAAATINTEGDMFRGVRALGSGVVEGTLGPIGWVTLPCVAVYYVARVLLYRTESLAFRHRLAAHAPVFSRRCAMESNGTFTWHLDRLQRAGIAPRESWALAARAVPNLTCALALADSGDRMSDTTKLSEAARNAKTLPPDYAALLETGEATGTVSQALGHAGAMCEQEMREADAKLKWRSGCWAVLVMVGGSAVLYALFMRGYVDACFKHILGD